MDMELASLPSGPKESSLTPKQARIIGLLMEGHSPRAIAQALAKGDPKRARAELRKIHYMAGMTDAYAQVQLAVAKGQFSHELPAIVEALIKRAKRGRVDAAKLLLEMTGVYNPRSTVSHEHSGEINIKLDMGKRPEPVVDAEVVE